MPSAVAAVLWQVGAAWATEAAIAIIANAAIVNAAIAFTASTIYGNHQKRRAQASARAAYIASLKDREVTIRSAIAPRRWIYGRDRVSGPIIYAESTGDKKQFLHLVLALAAHECDAVEEIWFGDVQLPTPNAAGLITSGPFSRTVQGMQTTNHPVVAGVVTLPRNADNVLVVVATTGSGDNIQSTNITGYTFVSGTNTITGVSGTDPVDVTYEWAEGETRVRVKIHLGATGQVADADLVAESAGKWTTAHKGTGICYAYVRLEWDKEIFASTGVPEMKFVVRGRKVEDPRTVTTVWTDNTQLIVADWLKRYEGLNASAAEVPSAEVTSGANICDEVITLDLAATLTQKRYTFNGSFTSDQPPRSVLEDILQSMAGTAVWVQGRWLLRPGAYRTPAAAITPATLAGAGVSIVPKASRGDLFNAVRATYRDPAQNWAEVQAPLVTNAFYQTEDGGVRKVRNIQLSSAMDGLRAQRLAKIELERARQYLSVQFTTNLAGYDLAPTDTVPLALSRYGWSAGKVFEIAERTYNVEGTIEYKARETAAGVWAWNFGEATTVDIAPDTDLPNPYAAIPALTGLAAASGTVHLLRQGDGTIVSQAYLTWTASTEAFVIGGGYIEAQWHPSYATEWLTAPRMPGDSSATYISPLRDGDIVLFRIRQVNAVGKTSDWTTVSHQIIGKTEPPSNVVGLASSVKNAVGNINWNPCPDIDYAYTEIRDTDSDWGSSTVHPSFRGRANGWRVIYSSVGTYFWYARHFDQSGNYSPIVAMVSQVVTTNDLGSGSSASNYTLTINPDLHIIKLDAAGNVPSWLPYTSLATVTDITLVDDTANWTFTATSATIDTTVTNNNRINLIGWNSTLADPYWDQTVFLTNFDGNIEDLKGGRLLDFIGKNVSAKYINDTVNGDILLKLGNATNATTDNFGVNLYEAAYDLSLEATDLCFEGTWIMRVLPGRPRTLMQLIVNEVSLSPIYDIYWDTDNRFRAEVRTGATSASAVKIISNVVPVVGTLYHLALTRTGNVYRFFVNGVEAPTTVTSAYRDSSVSRQLAIGASFLAPGFGYTDFAWADIGWTRITKSNRGYVNGFTSPVNPKLNYTASSSVKVRASKASQTDLIGFIGAFVQRTSSLPIDAAVLMGSISQTSVTLDAGTDGRVPNASFTAAAKPYVSIKRGAAELIRTWTVTATVTSGLSTPTIEPTADGNNIQIRLLGMDTTADTGVVTVRATKVGYTDFVWTFTVLKNKILAPTTTIFWGNNLAGALPEVNAYSAAGTAYAEISINTDGKVLLFDSGSQLFTEWAWYSPTTAAIGANYDVVFTLLAGDAVTGVTMGAALALTTDRKATLTYVASRKSSKLKIDIRPSGFTSIVGGGIALLTAS